MAYKTILVLCDSSEAAASRIELARHLAERHGSHLIGLHIRPPFEMPVFRGAGFAGAAHYRAYEERTGAGLERSRQTFERIATGKTSGRRGPTTEWLVARGVVGGFATMEALAQARCADLVVLSQPGPDRPADGIPADLPEAVALWSGRPTLVVPYVGKPALPLETVIVCWKASREAARAAADALPILRQASKVIVLTVDAHPASGVGDRDPAADAAAWLARQDVKATIRHEVAADGDVGQKILSCAADIGADLIVVGAYGRSRMRELALGGVTRTMFRSMTVPVLMAH